MTSILSSTTVISFTVGALLTSLASVSVSVFVRSTSKDDLSVNDNVIVLLLFFLSSLYSILVTSLSKSTIPLLLALNLSIISCFSSILTTHLSSVYTLIFSFFIFGSYLSAKVFWTSTVVGVDVPPLNSWIAVTV